VALIGMAVTLRAEHHQDTLVLSWPTNAVEFTLQSTRSLEPPVAWTDSPVVPTLAGAGFAVTTNDISGTKRFFRLRRP